MKNRPQKTTLTAANDNSGGVSTVEITLSDFVSVLAKAYVAKAQSKERSA